MEFQCFAPGCSSAPLLFCNCKSPLPLLCSEHIHSHITADEGLDHICKTIYKKVNEAKRKAIIIKTQEILTKIKNTKQSFTREHQKALEHLEKTKTIFLANFQKCKETYKKILSDAQTLEKILGFPGELKNKYIDADIEVISKLLEEAHEILPPQKLLEGQLQFFESFSKNLFITEFEKEIQTVQLNSIFFFKPETKILVELDVDSIETTESEVNLPENLGLLASICSVPGGKLFYHGGYSGEGDVISSTYIINPSTRHVEILPKCRLRCAASAIYTLGSIYIFGGYGKIPYKNCDKFNLKTRGWEEIADLPTPMQNTSTVMVKNTIVISGLGSCVYLYDMEANTFKTLISTLNIGSFNVLVKESMSVYLLSSGVFLSTEETLDKWLFTERISEIFSSTTCRPVIRERFAYFLCQDGEIVKFSLDTLEVLKIKQLFY